MPLNVVIVGGVAAGPKAAARIMRLEPEARVTVVEKGRFLSYAGCGLPYFVSGVVRDPAQLMSTPVGELRDAIFFRDRKRFTIRERTEAVRVLPARKQVLVRDLEQGVEQWLDYDRLILCTGGQPVMPTVPGVELPGVFSLHGPGDAEGVRAELTAGRAKEVVILGGGLIGLEMTDALVSKGCRVTVVEVRSQILPDFDREMALLVTRHLKARGVDVLTRARVEKLQAGPGDRVARVVLLDGTELPADMVILAAGIEPCVDLAREAGVELGETGAIKVDAQMRTSLADVLAAGDCVELPQLVTGQPIHAPLGSVAAKTARVAANTVCGHPDSFPGVADSVLCKVLGLALGRTGLGETRAREAGLAAVGVLAPGPDRPHFMPGATQLVLKLTVERGTRRVLGAQAVGEGRVDRRLDLVAVAIAAGWTVDQLAHADLTYAPPYSPAVDNVLTACDVARNVLDGLVRLVSSLDLQGLRDAGEGPLVLDVRSDDEHFEWRAPDSVNIPLGELDRRLDELPRDRPIVTYCKTSLRAYEAALLLRNRGFEDLGVLAGGLVGWPFDTDMG